jgi:tRNA(Ile)-lysidine synthetase-like protein
MLEQKFEEQIKKLLPLNTDTLVVAVSGGADSLALCLLAKYYAAKNNLDLYTATVDHNLRNDSRAEATYTNNLLNSLEISHQTFIWQHETDVKRLHENARMARYQLLTDYTKQFKNSALLTAHHAHDQAETVLMRLLKGSALKGLSGIQSLSTMHDTTIIRPLLTTNPEDLRTYLKLKNIQWLEDPSNTNTRFERTRIRNILGLLQKEGFAIEGINKSAEHLKNSFDSLELSHKQYEQNFVLKNYHLPQHRHCEKQSCKAIHTNYGSPRSYRPRDDANGITIDQTIFFDSPLFVQIEFLRNHLYALGNSQYPKPFKTIEAVLEILKAPKVNDYKICGCNIKVAKKIITITPAT